VAHAACTGASPDTAGAPRSSLLHTVKQVELAIRSFLDDLLKPAGISAPQYTALTELRRHDGLSSAQLARSSFVTPQSMADVVTGLEQRGLITRRRNPANRRVLLISLTEAGQEVLGTYDDAVNALEERMLSGLTEGQRHKLDDYLHRCRSALSDTPAL